MNSTKKGGRSPKLYTLTEVSKQTGISMPTLQKYKKEHADRIPSEGEGRKQRYPKKAFAVFRQLKKEGLERRKRRAGRPRKSASSKQASKSKKGKTVKQSEADGELLSLQKIRNLTGISYPTLLRYVKLHLDKLPHVGEGRKRRFKPEAVEVFREIRRNSPRGRRPKDSSLSPKAGGAKLKRLEQKIDRLEKGQSLLERQVRQLNELLRKPMTITMKR